QDLYDTVQAPESRGVEKGLEPDTGVWDTNCLKSKADGVDNRTVGNTILIEIPTVDQHIIDSNGWITINRREAYFCIRNSGKAMRRAIVLPCDKSLVTLMPFTRLFLKS